MRLISICFIASILILGCTNTEQPNWGKIVNGLQCRISTSRKIYEPNLSGSGKGPILIADFRNTSNIALDIRYKTDPNSKEKGYILIESFNVKILESNGQEVPYFPKAWGVHSDGPDSELMTLKPGDIWTVKSPLRGFMLHLPDTYQITLCYEVTPELVQREKQWRKGSYNIWTGEIISNTITIQIK